MNSDFVRWLLNVDVIPKDSGALQMAWERPWPAWVWSIVFMVCAVFALWSYTRMSGWRGGRAALAVARFGLLFLLVVLISGPMLELPRESVEQDWVLMLADRSASMNIKDAPRVEGGGAQEEGAGANSATGGAERVTRDAQLAEAMRGHGPMFDALNVQRRVVWLGFHAGAFNLDANEAEADGVPAGAQVELGPADGSRTNLESALEQALQRAAARPVSGVVVFSDGRTDTPPNRALLRRLQADAIPVFTVPLGSAEPIGDVAIRRVEAPRRAFIRDKVPVVVELDRLGAAVRVPGATVQLIDEATGEALDSVELDGVEEGDQLTLTAEPRLAGEATWRVVVNTPQPDLIPENNLRSFNVELVDRPLRVLFVEGYPRWEYRYVKNLLVREKSIESSVMLISADRDFAQEGNLPITRLPRSSEEFAAFDVIILGDVPATFFSPDQLNMMRAHVADRGAGLLWIAGERAMPATYVGTALADLLPMRGSLNLPAIGMPVTMAPTPLAQRLGVLQLVGGGPSDRSGVGWPEELSDPSYGWSRLFWAQRIEPGQLKPAAEVLAQTAMPIAGSPLPLVVNMRYGAGQTMYVATDEVWRWRYGRGELYPDQFWMQMIRMLGRESIASTGEPASLEANPRRVAVGQPVRFELRLLDSQLVQARHATVRVALQREDGSAGAEIELRRVDGTEDRYAATYLPDTPGQYTVSVRDATLGGMQVQAPLEVFAPDDELRMPETDHELLAGLSEATGGRVLRPDELNELPRLLPNRAVRTINPLTEPIWDSPLAFVLALTLLTMEWVGRKLIRLV